MDKIIQGKIVVGSVLKGIKHAKIHGKLDLKNLYLLNVVGRLMKSCTADITFEQKQKLETLYNYIKYNDKKICNYNKKDYKSFKGIKFCENCGTNGINNRTLIQSDLLPTVSVNGIAINKDYKFEIEDFTRDFFDPYGGTYETVRITSLPSVGLLTYNNIDVVPGLEFNINTAPNLLYTLRNTSSTITESFSFQTSNNNINKLFSNMAEFTINVQAKANQPPSQVGDGETTIQNAATYVFTKADFTTNTTPPYVDPEGDAANLLKVTPLPIDGKLQFDGSDVTLNQIISFSGPTSIESGSLRYIAEQNNPSQDVEKFEFQIADAGSSIFVG